MKHLLYTLTLVLALGLTACQSRTDADVDMADTTAVTSGAMGANTVVDLAKNDPQFSTLVQALQATGLDQSLQQAGPFTVFAPTNDAFAKLGAQVDTLMLEKNRDQLTQILLYHVADGKMMAADVTGMTNVTTLQGGALTVTNTDGTVMLNNAATVTGTDFDASNGVIHVIDTVLLPPTSTDM